MLAMPGGSLAQQQLAREDQVCERDSDPRRGQEL